MTWRDPRSPRETVEADCKNLRELADTYHPFVRWSDSERFFPALAEAWIQHATAAPWDSANAVAAPPETGFDLRRRGTALCVADVGVDQVSQIAGAPNPDDAPISLDPNEIAKTLAAYSEADSSWFLDLAGWAPQAASTFRGSSGDLDYLYRVFSELAAAINPKQSWSPVELMSHLPTMWTPQPPTPTVYCEARTAADFPGISQAMDHPDFPAGSEGTLDDVMVLTYHYLFPAREPSGGEPDVRSKEGQWEAVSIFFRTVGKEAALEFQEPPLAVAVSQGNDGSSPNPNSVDFRLWADVHRDDTHAHPIVFSALGSHRFFFAPLDPTQPWQPSGGTPGAPGGGSYDNNSEFPGWESVLIGGLLIALVFLAAGLWPVAVVIAVLAVLLWLISLIADLCNDDSENPDNPFPSNPEATGDGAQSGDPDGPPAPGSAGGSGAGGDGQGGEVFGVPNSGSPTGGNTSSFDVRFINGISQLRRAGDRKLDYTGYPSSEACEHPTWWDYAGRWGVRVSPGLDGTWASGDQRVDEHGRSWGYWHTLRFFQERMLGHV